MLRKSPLLCFSSAYLGFTFSVLISSNCFHLHFTYLKERDPGPRAGGRYSGFKVTGMIEDFWGVRNFRFQDFWGEGIFGKYFFGWNDLRRVLGVFKTIWRFVVVPAYPAANTNIQFRINFSCYII